MSEIKPVSIKTAEQRFNEDCEAMNLICVDGINQAAYFKAEIAELRAALEAIQNEVMRLQEENAKLKEESQNYENAVRIVQEWSSEITLANGELRKANAAQAKEITHWKANHADLKERLYVATHRTDLPSDRLPLFDDCKRKIAHQQFLIDSLMIEYCPDEMTVEQLENWKVHQRKAEL
jgi:chromosome segregation ATPase